MKKEYAKDREKMISVDLAVREKIRKIAKAEYRTLKGVIAMLVDMYEEKKDEQLRN